MASKRRKPGQHAEETRRRDSKHHPKTRNPHSGPVLSDLVSGRGQGRRGHMDSRGNTYRSVPSGQKKGAGS